MFYFLYTMIFLFHLEIKPKSKIQLRNFVPLFQFYKEYKTFCLLSGSFFFICWSSGQDANWTEQERQNSGSHKNKRVRGIMSSLQVVFKECVHLCVCLSRCVQICSAWKEMYVYKVEQKGEIIRIMCNGKFNK